MKNFLKNDELGFTKGMLFLVSFFLLMSILGIISPLTIALKSFSNSETGDSVVKIIYPLISTGLLIFVLIIIRKILIATKNKNPFTKENISRIKLLGFLFIGMDVTLILITGIWSFVDTAQMMETKLPMSGGGFLPGGILLAISEVFRIGIKLKNENELTV